MSLIVWSEITFGSEVSDESAMILEGLLQGSRYNLKMTFLLCKLYRQKGVDSREDTGEVNTVTIFTTWFAPVHHHRRISRLIRNLPVTITALDIRARGSCKLEATRNTHDRTRPRHNSCRFS
jgi:hypothetical protein